MNLSKTLSYLLRHDPTGLNMNECGEVSLELLAHHLEVSEEDIRYVVRHCPKKRFTINEDTQSVRAVQGHSIPVILRTTPYTGELLCHGTKKHNLDSIREKGLIPGDREYVHLAQNYMTAVEVADRRAGETVVLAIDVRGLEMLVAENGVVLCKHVPPENILSLRDGAS